MVLSHTVVMFPCTGSRFAQLELTVLSPAQVVATCVPLSLRDDGVPWRPGALALFVLLHNPRTPDPRHRCFGCCRRRFRVVVHPQRLLRGVFQEYE
jgi:hypothetical protein